MRALILFLLLIPVTGFSSYLPYSQEQKIWKHILKTKEADSAVLAIIERKHHCRYWYNHVLRGSPRELSEAVLNSSLSTRKKFYRHFAYLVLHRINARFEFHSAYRFYMLPFFEKDHSHFIKYFPKIGNAELQLFFKRYYHRKLKGDFSEYPDDFLKFKAMDRRVYLISRAEFNKLRDADGDAYY